MALLLLAASAGAAALVVGRMREGTGGDSGEHYICPMHSEVASALPGTCPICRMELERVAAGGTGAHSTSVHASTFQVYDAVRLRGFGQDRNAPAWMDGDGIVAAILYKDELAELAPEERDVFTSAATPGVGIEVHPLAETPTPWDRSTCRVRFRSDSPRISSRRSDVGWVRLTARRRELPVISYSAVLEGNEGPYVLVASGDGQKLTKQGVEIGRVLGGLAVVLSGLRQKERILVRSAFFVDAERRLRQEEAIELTP